MEEKICHITVHVEKYERYGVGAFVFYTSPLPPS